MNSKGPLESAFERWAPANPYSLAMHVRPAEPGDASSAAAVLRRSITELCAADHLDDPETLEAWLANKTPERFLRWLDAPGSHVVVAEAGGDVCGVGLIDDTGTLRLCYVLPEHVGSGVGHAMLVALERRARAWGLERIRLDSTRTARDFYARHGYEPAGGPTCGFGVSACHPMEKRL